MRKIIIVLGIAVFLGGCAVAAKHAQKQWTEQYGNAEPRTRAVETIPPDAIDYWTDVKPVIEKRCIACHACYDAACQLKMTAIEGIERGMSKTPVYETSRLKAAPPGRLFEDAHSVEEWRALGYFSALNEHADNPQFNRDASLIYRSLLLKEDNPLPTSGILPADDYTFGLGRAHECPTTAEFDSFAADHPQWGMPYALPGLGSDEQAILKGWVEAGASYTLRKPLDAAFNDVLNDWESFFNQDSVKAQLVSRYIYEHLYLSNLYFPDISERTFFKMVRSKTPPGQPVDIIATRRPFDDPGVTNVYYRIIPQLETIVDKTHNPYRLDVARKERWESLFFDPVYDVNELPGYRLPNSANPFEIFAQLPMEARYRYMLDEAQSTIMNFIKGSVCRGQVAVNVIRDHFWVFFLDPDSAVSQTTSDLLPMATEELALANSVGGDSFMPLSHWIHYSRLEDQRREGRDEFMYQYFSEHPLNTDLVWDGDGTNPNAALTIFRHLDSATVEKGLIGDIPQTVWFIDYTLLERIHYLLVAGYDVYGSLGHQLISRLHMDFLRMEGETNFINFLPKDVRQGVRKNWYRDAPKRVFKYLENKKFDEFVESSVKYTTDDPRTELIGLMRDRVTDALPSRRDLDNVQSVSVRNSLQRLSQMKGKATLLLPELSIVRINGGHTEHVTLLRNNAHKNMTSIFRESKRLLPAENTVTVAHGFLGSYPNAFFDVDEVDINRFVDRVLAIREPSDYSALMAEFGIRRTNPKFWEYSDALYSSMLELSPLTTGYLDYNRLENR